MDSESGTEELAKVMSEMGGHRWRRWRVPIRMASDLEALSDSPLCVNQATVHPGRQKSESAEWKRFLRKVQRKFGCHLRIAGDAC